MLLQNALMQYARTDPEAALAYVQINEPDNIILEQQVLGTYAMSNIELAIPLIEDYVRRTGNSRILSSVLSGWVQKIRDLGHMIFIDVRDRYGITQINVPGQTGELGAIAKELGREF